MSRTSLGTLRAALAFLLVVLAALPALAAAQGIVFTRSPAPPQAILQSGTQNVGYQITFDSVPTRYELSIVDPMGQLRSGPTSIDATGVLSPINGSQQYVPGSGAPLGRYQARVAFFSSPGGQTVPEVLAQVAFDVADKLGTLQLIKFEDANGNGVRDPGEPGVPGWRFSLINPQGNNSAAVTGPDGTVTIPSVPAGVWQVTEVQEPGWVPITPVTGPTTVPADGVGAFTAGNARPANICGIVFIDANRNGQLDPGEQRHAGANLVLNGGADGTQVSGPDGAYCFTALKPGGYGVKITVPAGLTNTTPVAITNIALRSGIDSLNNNFGLAPRAGVNVGGPVPDIAIRKAAPATEVIEGVFDYSIVVHNRSGFTARDVVVTDLVPAQVTLVSIPRGATIRNGVVTWELGDMTADAKRTLTMRVKAIPSFTGLIVNTATVTAESLRPRRSTARTRIVGPPVEPRSGGVTG